MSQAKVDKYKEEKKNRAKTIKKNRIKKAIAIVVCAMLVGAAIGVPLGHKIYKNSVEQAKANATVSVLEFDDWFKKYWVANYSNVFTGTSAAEEATSTDATNTDAATTAATSETTQ